MTPRSTSCGSIRRSLGFTVTPSAGAITLTRAGGTPAQFTTALRAIQFRNTDDDPDDRNDGTANPSVADRTVQVVADDGPATSTPVTRNVTITPVNDAPSAPTPCPDHQQRAQHDARLRDNRRPSRT